MFHGAEHFEDDFNNEVQQMTLRGVKSLQEDLQECVVELGQKYLDKAKRLNRDFNKLKHQPNQSSNMLNNVELAINYQIRALPIFIRYYQNCIKAKDKYYKELEEEFA